MTDKLLHADEQHPFFRNLIRYGIPLIIIFFYVTASLFFNYTAESSFATFLRVRDGHPDSLWGLLVSAALLFKLDVVLAAKVLSLFFACLAILFSYLIANELLHSHLLSFCVTLTLTMQAWLVQLAPSGSGLCFALFLTGGTMFFLLRNEYIVAAVFAGLATLTLWPAVILLPVLLIDEALNSVDKRLAAKMIVAIVLTYLSVLLPWGLFSLYSGGIIIPMLHDSFVLSVWSPQLLVGIVILLALSAVGSAILLFREREAFRALGGTLMWLTIGLLSGSGQLMVLVAPLIIVFGFFGLKKIFEHSTPITVPFVALSLTTLLLLHHQFVALPEVRRSMNVSIMAVQELKAISSWLRTNVSDDEAVAVPGQHRDLIQFYSEKRISDENARFVVAEAGNAPGDELAFDPTKENIEMLASSSYYQIWRRK